MKLCIFHSNDKLNVGIIDHELVADVTTLHPELNCLTQLFEFSHAKLREIYDQAPKLNLRDLQLATPIPRPSKFLAIGYNYSNHLAETATPRPERQVWFNKQPVCIIGPNDPIWIPFNAPDFVDYEGELGVVIGKRCKHVPNDPIAVTKVIAGFTIVNDVSVRDWQKTEPGMVVSKSFDTHGPIGPWIVTPDEVGDPLNLRLETWLNDELRQTGCTGEMLFNIYDQISYLSSAFTLEPGDVIATGTPSGVAWMNSEKCMKAGDVVRIKIEKIGELCNPVIHEPRHSPV